MIKNNCLKILSIIFTFMIIFTSYGSSNIYNETDENKMLEIKEEYVEKYNIKEKNINIEDVGTDYLISINASFENNNNINIVDKDLYYNTKKVKNQTYNTNEYYIICSSTLLNNLETYWYRAINTNSNVGNGYIKDKETYLTKRKYGIDDNEFTQNNILYTNNKVINIIQGTNNLENFNITNKSLENFSFSFTMNKLNNIKYIYIGNMVNVKDNENATYYVNAISEPIILDFDKKINLNEEKNRTEYKKIKQNSKIKIHFMNDNNASLILNAKLYDKEVYIDDKIILNNYINYKGYKFEGWTLNKGGDEVDFLNGEIINFEDLENEEIYLYPVYKKIEVGTNK